MRITLAIALAAATLTGCASGETSTASVSATKPRACFLPDDVGGWKDAGDNMVTISTTRGDIYQAKLYAPCPDLDFTQELALLPEISSRVCEGEMATIIIRHPVGGPGRCRIDKLHGLSPEEVAALPSKARP